MQLAANSAHSDVSQSESHLLDNISAGLDGPPCCVASWDLDSPDATEATCSGLPPTAIATAASPASHDQRLLPLEHSQRVEGQVSA